MKDASQGEAVYVCHVPSSVKAASFPASQIPACTWSQGNVMSLSDKAQEAVTHLSSRRKVAHAWLTLTAWYLTSVFKLEEFFSMLWSTLQAFTKLHGTSHTTSFWQTQKLKFTKYLQSWQKQEVALCWLDTGGHWLSFLPPCLQQDVLSRFRWLIGMPSMPSWLGWHAGAPRGSKQYFGYITRWGACVRFSQKWAGQKPWTNFQSPIFRQLGGACVRSHCHPIHHTHTCSHRSAELEQKLLCLCLPN